MTLVFGSFQKQNAFDEEFDLQETLILWFETVGRSQDCQTIQVHTIPTDQ